MLRAGEWFFHAFEREWLFRSLGPLGKAVFGHPTMLKTAPAKRPIKRSITPEQEVFSRFSGLRLKRLYLFCDIVGLLQESLLSFFDPGAERPGNGNPFSDFFWSFLGRGLFDSCRRPTLSQYLLIGPSLIDCRGQAGISGLVPRNRDPNLLGWNARKTPKLS